MFEFIVPFLIGTALGIDPAPMDDTTVAAIEDSAADMDTGKTVTASIRPDQMFTTAENVKPILEMTQRNWVAVHGAQDQDILYFTHLASWRCGLESVAFGINGAPPSEPIALEPCYAETSAPNALMVTDGFAPYVVLEADSIRTVTVVVAFDDGTDDLVMFRRGEVLLR